MTALLTMRVKVGAVALCALLLAAGAAGHPGAPFRSVAQAQKEVFDPQGEYGDKWVKCRGLSPSLQGRLFRHFLCISLRKDGIKFSTFLHTTATGWDNGPIKCLSGPSECYRDRVIGRETASGDFATAIASGSVDRPQLIYIDVFANPDQQISVQWTAVCSRGAGAGSRSGSYSDYSASSHEVRVPMADPDSCVVSAGGSLDRSGTIVVSIRALT